MNRYDENYSAYFKAPSAEYPEGAAVDSSSEDNLDGTPYLAAFFNDVIGFMYAAFHGVFGNPKVSGETVTREISNTPDNAQKSDVWDAIKTFVQRKADAVKQSLDEFIATKGQAGGFAPLDESGLVSSQYLPSYVDDVLEYARKSAFPAAGETGKIYVALDTNKSYRWSGSTYIELSKYDDATTTASGLMSAADKAKLNGIASGAQVNTVTSVSGRSGNVTNDQIRSDMAVMSAATASAAGEKGLVPPPPAGAMAKFLMGDGTWGIPASATVDDSLSKTSTNAVQNKVVTANMYTAICNDNATATPKSVNIDGFVLTEGCTVRILFKNANTANNPKLKVNSYDAMDIVAYRNGERILLSTTTDASGNTRGWDAYTTLELVYDGADFVVMGNPVLLSKFDTDSGYEKRANGLLVQWGVASRNGGNFDNNEADITLPLAYSRSYVCTSNRHGSKSSLVTGYIPSESNLSTIRLYSTGASKVAWKTCGY